MKILLLIFTTLALNIPFIPSTINNSTDLKNKEPKLLLTEDTLPTDFFGDYSHPEFWVEKETREVTYQRPSNTSLYDYHFSYEGRGKRTFKTTLVFLIKMY